MSLYKFYNWVEGLLVHRFLNLNAVESKEGEKKTQSNITNAYEIMKGMTEKKNTKNFILYTESYLK